MNDDPRPLVTVRIDSELHQQISNAATAHGRSLAEEIETRLVAVRVLEETLKILLKVR